MPNGHGRDNIIFNPVFAVDFEGDVECGSCDCGGSAVRQKRRERALHIVGRISTKMSLVLPTYVDDIGHGIFFLR